MDRALAKGFPRVTEIVAAHEAVQWMAWWEVSGFNEQKSVYVKDWLAGWPPDVLSKCASTTLSGSAIPSIPSVMSIFGEEGRRNGCAGGHLVVQDVLLLQLLRLKRRVFHSKTPY